jgi:hypothetical protein
MDTDVFFFFDLTEGGGGVDVDVEDGGDGDDVLATTQLRRLVGIKIPHIRTGEEIGSSRYKAGW